MRTITFTIILVFFSVLSVLSQENWFELSSGTNQNLNSVYFTDSNTGFVCGNGGVILKTTDAGETWEIKESGTNVVLNSIHFPSNDIGYIVGNDGHILKTTDAGESWEVINSDFSGNMASVFFTSENTGYVTSYFGYAGYIIKTDDGGNNWTVSFTENNPNQILRAIQFVDQNVGFVIGTNPYPAGNTENFVIKTTDAGINWEFAYGPSLGNSLTALFFVNDTCGYVSCVHVGFKTTDAGDSWFYPMGPDPDYYNFLACPNSPFSMYFTNTQNGYLVGYTHTFLHDVPGICMTSNGGYSWSQSFFDNLFGHIYFYDVFFTDEQIGYVVGSGGLIFKTTNAGGLETDTETSISKTNVKELFQIFPNPAFENAEINYELKQNGFVNISIYDLNGRLVKSLISDKNHKTGSFQISLNTSNFNSGVYFCVMTTESEKSVKKLVVI